MTELCDRGQVHNTLPSHHILLIEDDAATAEMLVECIESQTTYRVRSLPSGEDLLQRLQEVSEVIPSLFIIDYLLPGMNGLQILESLQGFNAYKHIPTIMITATALPDDMKTTLQERNIVLLNKPFDLNELIDYVEYVRHHLCQQLS